MTSITENLSQAADILHQSGIAAARREANSLLSIALQKDKTFLIAHPEYQLTEAEQTHFLKFIGRRAKREPFQYITGHQEFYRLDFEVTPDVLIPRPETEMIVENAVQVLKTLEKPIFCEVGVGSGCISVSILHELPQAAAIGLDISEKALKIAEKNADTHHVKKRLVLLKSDIFASLNQQMFEVIVSNPPYISNLDYLELQPEVKLFEPQIALTDHGNGLSIIENIVLSSPRFLKPGGYLFLEIGINQSDMVNSMFADKIWQTVKILPDLQGIPRLVNAQIK